MSKRVVLGLALLFAGGTMLGSQVAALGAVLAGAAGYLLAMPYLGRWVESRGRNAEVY